MLTRKTIKNLAVEVFNEETLFKNSIGLPKTIESRRTSSRGRLVKSLRWIIESSGAMVDENNHRIQVAYLQPTLGRKLLRLSWITFVPTNFDPTLQLFSVLDPASIPGTPLCVTTPAGAQDSQLSASCMCDSSHKVGSSS